MFTFYGYNEVSEKLEARKHVFGQTIINSQPSSAARLTIAAAFKNNIHTATPRTKITAVPHHIVVE